MVKNKIQFINLLLALFAFVINFSNAFAQNKNDKNDKNIKTSSYEDLLERIEKLEEQQQLGEEKQTHVNSFLKNRVSLGGFFESAFLYVNGNDTKSQANNTSNIIGINLGAEFNPKLKFVSQTLVGLLYPLLNEHNDPSVTTLGLPAKREFKTPTAAALIAQGYLQYTVSRYLQFQFGLGYTPFGFALQQREPTVIVHRGNSQFVRISKLAYPLWGGIHILGDLPIAGDPWGYNLYTFSAYYSPGDVGIGTRIWHSMFNRKLTFGISTQHGQDSPDKFDTFGGDIRYQFQSFVFTLEHARNFINNQEDPTASYLEIDYHLKQGEYIVYTIIGYADSSENETRLGNSIVTDPMIKAEYSTGLNWLPTSYTRYRLGLTYNDYRGETAIKQQQNRDYYGVDLSVGVAF